MHIGVLASMMPADIFVAFGAAARSWSDGSEPGEVASIACQVPMPDRLDIHVCMNTWKVFGFAGLGGGQNLSMIEYGNGRCYAHKVQKEVATEVNGAVNGGCRTGRHKARHTKRKRSTCGAVLCCIFGCNQVPGSIQLRLRGSFETPGEPSLRCRD